MTETFETKSLMLIDELLSTFPDLYLYGACAIAGNGGEESGGLNPVTEDHPLGGGLGGYSWFQWTGPRRIAFFSWCNAKAIDPNSDAAAIGFLIHELQTTQAAAITAMEKVPSLGDKVEAFMNTFERPNQAVAHLDVRIQYANRALAYYKANSSPAPAAQPAPTTTPPPPPVAAAGQEQGSTGMGSFFMALLPMAEQWILSNLSKIEPVILTEIEKGLESLFTKVNANNPATPDKTVVTKQ